MPAPQSPCPCGSASAYDACCGRLHAGAVAANAEQMMRSRYSAYVMDMQDYLLASWHPSTRPTALLSEEHGGMRWLGLAVKCHRQTSPETATVEFVARYRIRGGRAQRLHEISRFLRENDRWYYLDGSFPDA